MVFESDMLTIAQVGDSRAYRVGERDLFPLTRDHSWVAEIQDSQKLTKEEADRLTGRNIITRALGVRENVEVDCQVIKASVGDMFVLCSDGLCGFADDDEIFATADVNRADLAKTADNLVQMANDRGGTDNTTVVVVRTESIAESPLPPIEVFTIKSESESVLAAEDEWLERFRAKKAEAAQGAVTSDSLGKKESKLPLVIIFVIFAIVAVAIIYFSQQP
ncbi:MAG: SpoIIE family protein phosphatase, partial [candidate division Zixibacteria bacterium]